MDSGGIGIGIGQCADAFVEVMTWGSSFMIMVMPVARARCDVNSQDGREDGVTEDGRGRSIKPRSCAAPVVWGVGEWWPQAEGLVWHHNCRLRQSRCQGRIAGRFLVMV